MTLELAVELRLEPAAAERIALVDAYRLCERIAERTLDRAKWEAALADKRLKE